MTQPNCMRLVLVRRLAVTVLLMAAVGRPMALTGVAFAADPPLSLDQAAHLAITQQPQLQAKEAAIRSLTESAVAVRQLPDPMLNFGLASLPVDTFNFTQEPMTMAVLGVNQTIPGGAKRRLAGQRAERQITQGRDLLTAERRRIERDARLAWLDVYEPEAALALVRQIAAEDARQAAWSQSVYRTGKLSQADALAAQIQLETLRDRQTELELQVQRTRAALSRWLGEAAQGALAPLSDSGPFAPLTDLEHRLEAQPELVGLADAVAVSRAEADEAREAVKPDWTVGLEYGLRGGGMPGLISVNVAVDLPVFHAQRQDRRLAAKLADVEQAEQMRLDRRRALLADLRMAYADGQAADERIRRYDQQIIPLSDQRAASALNAYRVNQAGYDRVLEARRAGLEARINRIAQQVARARAAVQIRYLTEE